VSPGLVITDARGEARTTLKASVETIVTATVGEAEGQITIPAPGALTLEVTTATPELGVRTDFSVAPSANAFFSQVVIDFGDGSAPLTLGAVSAERAFSHTYSHLGSFTVTATATTATGVTTVASKSVFVSDRAPVGVTLSASPASSSLGLGGGIITFTATATGPGGAVSISAAHWTFGDGQGGTTTGLSNSHKYTAAGTYTAKVRVESVDGRAGEAFASVTITP
jgi:hypothetical protein